jgi:multisubunit Na+/H+ antiporter MnhF subunit
VNAFEAAAVALLAGYLPLLWCVVRRRPIDGLVALELGSAIGVLVLLCLAEGLHRSFEYGVAVIAALLSWIGGLVIARFLGRWL